MGPHSRACEVLPQGRWESVFPNDVQIIAEKKSSDHQNNKVVMSTDGDIILDCQIKTHDSWVARVEFLWENSDERVQPATAHCKKNINHLHVEVGHPSKSITHATYKAIGIQVTVTFNLCEDCTLGKAKQ